MDSDLFLQRIFDVFSFTKNTFASSDRQDFHTQSSISRKKRIKVQTSLKSKYFRRPSFLGKMALGVSRDFSSNFRRSSLFSRKNFQFHEKIDLEISSNNQLHLDGDFT